MSTFKTEQEQFWVGDFGNDYVDRNQGVHLLACKISLFARVLAHTDSIKSVIEFGSNVGLNLKALSMLLCDVKNSAIEINQKAANQLQASGDDITIYNQSILDFKPDYSRDLVLASGILIHLDPENLPRVYELMFQSSHRYICIAEYYNPTPVEVPYRGHQNKMFKRDFAGEMLDKFQDLRLLDYGFVYHRDTQFPQDDVNWFLLEKISRKL